MTGVAATAASPVASVGDIQLRETANRRGRSRPRARFAAALRACGCAAPAAWPVVPGVAMAGLAIGVVRGTSDS